MVFTILVIFSDEDFASILYNFSSLASTSPLIQFVIMAFSNKDIETVSQNIYASALQQYLYDSSIKKQSEYVYGNGSKCSKQLAININENIKYAIKISKKGKITYFQITDGEKQYSYNGKNLNIDNILFEEYTGLKVTCK